jgi:hypothetical protein
LGWTSSCATIVCTPMTGSITPSITSCCTCYTPLCCHRSSL